MVPLPEFRMVSLIFPASGKLAVSAAGNVEDNGEPRLGKKFVEARRRRDRYRLVGENALRR